MYLLANTYFIAPAEKVACFLSSLLKLELSSIPIPALNTKINRLINEYKSKGGKGRQLLLDKQFYIPTATTTQVVSKIEQNIIKELSAALHTSDAIIRKQQYIVCAKTKRLLGLIWRSRVDMTCNMKNAKNNL